MVELRFVMLTDQTIHKNATKSITANRSVISPTHARTKHDKTTEDVIYAALSRVSRPARQNKYDFASFDETGLSFSYYP